MKNNMSKKTIESIKKMIGEKVRKARQGKKISQFELAKKAGCTGMTIHSIESGNSNCNITTLIKIKQELNIDELFI